MKKHEILADMIQTIIDNGHTPLVTINNGDTVKFPLHFEQMKQLTFVVSPKAVRNLVIDSDGISFSARFSGMMYSVYAPLSCIESYSVRETNQEFFVKFDETDEPTKPHVLERFKPNLTVIDGGKKGDGIPCGKLKLVV